MFSTAGLPGPAVNAFPTGNGSVVLSWSGTPVGPGGSSGDSGELVGYVTEWTSGPGELRWNTESRDQNTALVEGEALWFKKMVVNCV